MVAAQYRLLHHEAVMLYSLYQENQSAVQGCGFGGGTTMIVIPIILLSIFLICTLRHIDHHEKILKDSEEEK
jgi:hypothetical protein